MPLLNNVVNLLTQLNRANLTITPNRCTKVRHRLSSCHKCAQVCPGAAISIVDNKFSIIPENCVQCGACATACPTDAITGKAPTDFELVQTVIDQLQANPNFVFAFACSPFVAEHKKQLDLSKIIELPCLARLSESVLLAMTVQLLQARGISSSESGSIDSVPPIYLLRMDCKACPNSSVLSLMHQTQQNLSALLSAWSLPALDQFLHIATELPAQFTSEKGHN